MKKKQLQVQIQELQKQIEVRKGYMNSMARMCGYATELDYQMSKQDIAIKYKDYKKVEMAK